MRSQETECLPSWNWLHFARWHPPQTLGSTADFLGLAASWLSWHAMQSTPLCACLRRVRSGCRAVRQRLNLSSKLCYFGHGQRALTQLLGHRKPSTVNTEQIEHVVCGSVSTVALLSGHAHYLFESG